MLYYDMLYGNTENILLQMQSVGLFSAPENELKMAIKSLFSKLMH